MSDHPAKQKVVDKLKSSETVLVTVSSNPSVDELSAALGLTVLLNKLNKHATAVFSGDIPPAITFLDPEKTFENTVDSLRDFIIALDKERADHLRYKVEGDMVKIFITPYRTTIDQQDFEFSQGDYNVEMVIAIGVQSEDDLDRALSGHGRILHDAVVASLSVGEDKSQLGAITWHDDEASSYSEVMVGLAESLKGSKNPIDEQIATAFLTGIVAATERFSNSKTSAKAMTIAAQLMAAGANQQLIATQLEEAEEIGDSSSDIDTSHDSDESSDTPADATEPKSDHSSVLKVERDDEPTKPVKDQQAADGSMAISHEKQGTVDEVAEQVARERQEEAAQHAEEQLADSLAGAAKPSDMPTVDDLKRDLEEASEEIDQAAAQTTPDSDSGPILPAPMALSESVAQIEKANEPRLGGALSATTEQAADEKRRELDDDRNKTILSHDTGGYLETPPTPQPTVNSYSQPVETTSGAEDGPLQDSFQEQVVSQKGKTLNPVGDDDEPTLADIDAENRGQTDARSEIELALEQGPAAGQVGQSSMLPPLPPMPDFSTLPELPMNVSSGFMAPPQNAVQHFIPTPESSLPTPQVLQELSSSGTASFQPPAATHQQVTHEQALSERLGEILPSTQPPAFSPRPPQSTDPTQFQIPN